MAKDDVVATSAAKRAKTETLSLRLDPKTKFVLDFIARVQGQSITTVVERAIKDTAKVVVIEAPGFDPDRTWDDYWDVSEGMRTLFLLKAKNVPTTYEEDEIVRFTRDHWPFFYTTDDMDVLRRHYVDLLWPKIDKYVSLWRDERHANFWAAGEAMQRDLTAAKLAAPDWPIKKPTSAPVSKGPKETFAADLDDDIPF